MTTERTIEELQAENERLKLELQNSQLEHQKLLIDMENAGLMMQAQQIPVPNIPMGPESDRQVVPEQPKGPGGFPVPRAPLGADSVPPKEGDIVNVACRSGAIIRATGMKCHGRKQKIQGKVNQGDGISGGGGRRVIYVCQTCSQPWHVVY